MTVALNNNFFASARGLTFTDTSSVTWTFNKNTNLLTATTTGVNGSSPQATGFGTPVGAAVVANYNITDAGGANSNTNKCVAEILTVLKAAGIIGA